MIIKLKGTLDPELRAIGLNSDDLVKSATMDPISHVGAVHFSRQFNGHHYDCVVWPENYEIIKADKSQPKVQFTIT